MNKLRNTLLLFLIFISFNASAIINDLVVFCNDGEAFTLIMNGERYNDAPKTKIKVTGLDLKEYSVKIIFSNPKIKEHNTTLTFFNTNKECVFSLDRVNKKKYSMNYRSSKDIEGTVSTEVVEQTTNTNSNSSIPNTTSTGNTPDPNSTNSVSINTGLGNVGVNENGSINIGGKNGTVNVNTKNPSGHVAINVGGQTVNLNKAEKSNCSNPITALKLEEVKKSISSATSEAEKEKAVVSALLNNCYTASQVKSLMLMLKDDSSRMEVAKKSYAHINDLNNYKGLKEAFTKAESKEEFLEFAKDMK